MMNKLPINSSTCTNYLQYDQKQRSNQVQSPIIMSIAIQPIIHWSISSQNLDKQYNRQKYRSNQVQFPLSPVCTVHHVYHCIGVGIVAPPVRSYTSLSSEVPYLELEVFVSHCLHIKPNGGDGSHHLKVPLETILLKVSKVTTRPLQLVVCIRLWSSQRHQDQE